MSTINRRTFIKGTTAGSLFVLTLAGCSEKKDTPAKSAQTQGTAAGLKQASAKPHYVMVFDQNKCVGCGECKEACAETNKTPAGVFRLALERQNGREPGTACPYCGKIEPCDCERKYVRVSCQQCLDAPCVRVCPTQAAHRDPETNIVTMDPDKCVGCGECKEACAETNKTPAGVFRLALERQNGREPGTACPYCGKIEPCDCERKYVRVSCQQCLDAPCVRVCPTQAAHRDPETNIVTMDPDKCVGCKYCIAACPYNVRFINPQTRVAENCDFCLHTKLAKGEDPACVSKCRYGALAFGDLNDPNSYVAKLLDVKDAVRVRPYLGTEPSLRYIPVMKEKI